MKQFIVVALLMCMSGFTFAADFSLDDVCAKDPKKRFAFVEKLRDKIIDKTKDLNLDSKSAQKFDGSDMQQWLKHTYPGFMPKHLYDAGDKECADMHLDYLETSNPTATAKAFGEWKSCLRAAYRNDERPMITRLFKCYSAEPALSK